MQAAMIFKKLPPRSLRFVLPFLVSAMMSCLVSGISTFRAVGLAPEFMTLWGGNWLVSWAIAFPLLFVVMPVAARFARLLVAETPKQG